MLRVADGGPTARDALDDHVVRAAANQTISSVQQDVTAEMVAHVAVFDDSRFLGAVSMREAQRLPTNARFADLIAPANPPSLLDDAPLEECLELLEDQPEGYVSLLDTNGQFVGLVTMRSAVAALLRRAKVAQKQSGQRSSLCENAPLVVPDAERYLRNGLDHLFAFVAACSTKGTLLEINQAPLDAAGVMRKEVIGKPLWDTYWWSYKSAVRHQVKQALHRAAQGETVRYDVAIRVADDEFITIDMTFSPLYDAAGCVAQLVGSAVDITERKQAEESLRQSEERFRLLFDFDPAPLYVWRHDGSEFWLRNYNRAALTATEGHVAELLGRTLHDIYSNLPEVIDDFAQCWQTRRPVRREMLYHFRTFDKQALLDVAYIFIPPNAIMVRTEDVTERKRSEQALRDNEARLRTIIENMPVLIHAVDAQGNIVLWNSECERLTGYSAREVVKNPNVYGRVFPNREYRRQVRAQWERLKGNFRNWEVELTCKDGTTHMVSWSSISGEVPIPGWTDWAIGFDITQRKAAEDDVRRHRDQLAHVARLSTMGEMAAGIAHELNQPLTAIVNFSYTAATQLADPATGSTTVVRRLLEMIQVQALRAGSIISRLRKFVGKVSDQRRAVDANALIRNVVEMMLPDAHLANVAIELHMDDNLPCVMADQIQIEQVIVNLIRNAIEALAMVTPPRRTIGITTRCTDNNTVECIVQDTGPGIPSELLDQIFDPFTTTKRNGLGLGLAISRSIIEDHRGTLTVESSEDRGTKFCFRLPAVS